MQNFDFYEKKSNRITPDNAPRQSSSFFPDYGQSFSKEEDRLRKKASRIIFIISALCIISFTTGLAIGIKFAGGEDHKIVDDNTYEKVSKIGEKVSDIISRDDSRKTDGSKDFPRGKFPYLLKISADTSSEKSKSIASLLTQKGYRVVISSDGEKHNIYTGPYENREAALDNLNGLEKISEYSINSGIQLVKRK